MCRKISSSPFDVCISLADALSSILHNGRERLLGALSWRSRRDCARFFRLPFSIHLLTQSLAGAALHSIFLCPILGNFRGDLEYDCRSILVYEAMAKVKMARISI